jgi:ABC-2 type transport system permease protein
MIPVVIKPKVLAAKNRCRQSFRRKSLLLRDIFLILFAFVVVAVIYEGTLAMLAKMQVNANFAYMPPTLPLGLIFLFLLSMLFFSNCITALGAFYLGKDLDLIFASPLSPRRFFFGKLLDVTLSSSWMALIFGIPVVAAFATWYQTTFSFWALVSVALFPYFIIPAALAIALVTIFTVLIPANRTREVLLVAMALLLVAIYLVGKLLAPEEINFQNMDELLRVLAVLALPNASWMPSYWAAAVLTEGLQPSQRAAWPYLGCLYGAAIFLVASAFGLFRLCHYRAFSMAKDNRHGLRLSSARAQRVLVRLTPWLPSQFRGLIVKEFKVFARDMTQAIQLLLLLGLCMVYLYNFRILHSVAALPDQTKLWWQGFLVGSNLAMGAFVMTAVCTRFVFPSVSLEGQSFWILQTSPMSIRQILRAKFWCWLVPVASMSSVIFASGALAINAEPHIVVINALASWVVCYGIVGLATGLGALFANFDWEHSSQLAASFGSLVFMLSATVLIVLNLVPAGTLIFLRTLRATGYEFSSLEWYTAVGCCAALLSYLNFVATRWALQVGENALEARISGVKP